MNFKTLGLAAILVGTLAPTMADAAGPIGIESVTAAAMVSQFRPSVKRDNKRGRRTEDRRQDWREDRRDDGRDDWREDRREDRRDDWREDRREDRRDERRDERWERSWRYRVGVRLVTLPLRHTRVVIGPKVYYYSDGVYLVKRSGAYVVVGAPVGARIARLPYGFRSFWIGPRRFFFVNSTYYVYAPDSRDYVVVEAPTGANEAAQSMTPDPVVYPASSQSDEQIDQDRYECHRWAIDESDFDPTRSQQDSLADRDKYNRALTACLTGHGYTVT